MKVSKSAVDTYEKLGDPWNQGRLCIRLDSHPYNLSLFGAVTEHLDEAKAKEWLKGMVTSMARDPKGGDSDQIKGVASGECGIAVTNTYYLARIMRSNAPKDKAIAERVGVECPNQESWGTHVNIAGDAVAKTRKIWLTRLNFWSTWPAPTGKITLPTATMKGLSPKAWWSTTRH